MCQIFIWGQIYIVLSQLKRLSFAWQVTGYLVDTHTRIHETVKASQQIMADETSHRRNNHKRWIWSTLNNHVAFFQIISGRDQHTTKLLLGEAISLLLVTDQYSDYKYIDESKRQLCWLTY